MGKPRVVQRTTLISITNAQNQFLCHYLNFTDKNFVAFCVSNDKENSRNLSNSINQFIFSYLKHNVQNRDKTGHLKRFSKNMEENIYLVIFLFVLVCKWKDLKNLNFKLKDIFLSSAQTFLQKKA